MSASNTKMNKVTEPSRPPAVNVLANFRGPDLLSHGIESF